LLYQALGVKTGAHLGDSLAVMTDRFAPQVLSIKVDKILNAVAAGLKYGCFWTGNSLHFPSNVA